MRETNTPRAISAEVVARGRHLFTVASRPALEEAIADFIDEAMKSGGQVLLFFSGRQHEDLHPGLSAALPQLSKWEASGVVEYSPSEAVGEALVEPTIDGLEAFGEALAQAHSRGIRRGRRELWLVGGMVSDLVRQGRGPQAILAELFLHSSQCRRFPLTALCVYRGPLEANLKEALSAVHQGEIIRR